MEAKNAKADRTQMPIEIASVAISEFKAFGPAGLLPLACANSDDFEDGLKWQILTYVDIGGQM